ncbi:MAG TPA: hypothetical protein DHV68_02390 [Dehalococcoidia bacterium]|nr:hypothetical protein [Chloroflexota bacterium]HCI85675.1 hypothetical protein [Dehalococcoidia bacterium]|tara:strand:- start:119 stop:574 length:456 start_codon:yes stop_codon:yes gene_type:complete
MKDRKSAVLAAIDDNWRQFRDSLDQLVSEDMSVSGVLEGQSVTDIVGHVTSWEWQLATALDKGRIEPVGNVDVFNESENERKKGNLPRETLQEMDNVHRELRDQLAKAPSAYYEPFDTFREMIDSCTVLHYQEHGTHIRIWAGKHSRTALD